MKPRQSPRRQHPSHDRPRSVLSLRHRHAWSRPVAWLLGCWIVGSTIVNLASFSPPLSHGAGTSPRWAAAYVSLVPFRSGALIIRTRTVRGGTECWSRWIPNRDAADAVLQRDLTAGYDRAHALPWWGLPVLFAIPFDLRSHDSIVHMSSIYSAHAPLLVVAGSNPFDGLWFTLRNWFLVPLPAILTVAVVSALLYEVNFINHQATRSWRRCTARRLRRAFDARRCHRCSFEIGDMARIRICPECGCGLLRPDHVPRDPERRRPHRSQHGVHIGTRDPLAIEARRPTDASPEQPDAAEGV
ncbi:MAG: hypothetical protein AAGI53_00925 [Planctomycetota bacterium]